MTTPLSPQAPAKTAEAALKIMPVVMCGAVGQCQSSPSGYESACTSSYTYVKPSQERVASHALQQLEAARAKDVAAHEANLLVIENNKAVRAQVEALMVGIGMPAKWSERDRNSRARYPKTLTHDAGWKTDLLREVKTDDGFAHATHTYESLKKRYDEFAESAKGAAAREQAQRESEEKQRVEKRKADMALAAILVRYGLPPESEWSDVLDALRARDQRLDLAVAMSQTRGDWSEGAYRVRDALHRFTITTDEDKDIAADVAANLADFEDGRCFRDCTWSYGRLFETAADQQLSADVQLAMQHSESD